MCTNKKTRKKKVHLEVVHVAAKEDLWQLKGLKLVLILSKLE